MAQATRRGGPTGAAAAAAIVMAVSIAGCTSDGARQDAPGASGTMTRTPVPPTAGSVAPTAVVPAVATSPSPSLAGIPAGTLLATGRFTGTDDAATGTIDLRSTGGQGLSMRLYVTFESTAGATIELSTLDSRASADEFRTASSYNRHEAVVSGVDAVYPLPGYDDFFTSDPSWMRTAVLWAQQDAAAGGVNSGGVYSGRVIALAPLTWSMPDMRPGLAVHDAGAMAAARGRVALDADGAPISYTVARNDTFAAIAERFGLEPTDLAWLNPGRGTQARTDQALNLDRNRRVLH